jgi:hypothetical protein
MIKTMIFSPFFVATLFVLAGVFAVATIVTVVTTGASLEFVGFFAIGLVSFIAGKRIQFTR